MENRDLFLASSKRVLAMASNAESGNEELARYFVYLAQDLGIKAQLQPVTHSLDQVSKRQSNVLIYGSDSLVDRSTRKGLLMVNPLETTSAAAPSVVSDGVYQGSGALQGKLDFLCRLIALSQLRDRRHRHPIYLVGTALSHQGYLGSRFLVESLLVNPKKVIGFSPTHLQEKHTSGGQYSFQVEIEGRMKDKDPKGYRRQVIIETTQESCDFSSEPKASALSRLMEIVFLAVERSFDFEISHLEAESPEGGPCDRASIQLFLTSFQFEDFKSFLSSTLDPSMKVKYPDETLGAVRFIPIAMIQGLLQLSVMFQELFGSRSGIVRMKPKATGALSIGLEARVASGMDVIEMDRLWRRRLEDLGRDQKELLFRGHVKHMVPGVSDGREEVYALSDMGLFHQKKFEVSVMGLGSLSGLKTPSESVTEDDLLQAVRVYEEKIQSAILA